MLMCGLEVRPEIIRMVLTCNGEMPQFLEGQSFPPGVSTERLLFQLEAWKDFYQAWPEAVVCCRGDSISRELLKALENEGHEVLWVEEHTVREVLAMLRRLGVAPEWRRVGLLALLRTSRQCYPIGAVDDLTAAAWDWVYLWLRHQVVDLEAMMIAEGRSLLPYLECPDCRQPLRRPDDIPF